MFDGLRHPHGTAREVATDLSLVRSKVAKVGTYHAYWNGKLQYLSWLLWRCVMLCDAVLCMLCSVKHVKTVSTVRPCAAVVLVLKKHVLHFKIVYYCVVHWMSTTWNVGRYGVMLLVVCDVVCAASYMFDLVWWCMCMIDAVWLVAEFWASIILFPRTFSLSYAEDAAVAIAAC